MAVGPPILLGEGAVGLLFLSALILAVAAAPPPPLTEAGSSRAQAPPRCLPAVAVGPRGWTTENQEPSKGEDRGSPEPRRGPALSSSSSAPTPL